MNESFPFTESTKNEKKENKRRACRERDSEELEDEGGETSGSPEPLSLRRQGKEDPAIHRRSSRLSFAVRKDTPARALSA